jgi:hypothetical protein
MSEPHFIGQVETVSFPELALKKLKARIDTGAETSAIWASAKLNSDKTLAVTFLGDKCSNEYQNAFAKVEYKTTSVTSSNGHTEERYKIRLLISLDGRLIRAWFTLANREKQTYPVLIGRNILRKKFVVDVAK